MVLAKFHPGIVPCPQVVNDVKSQLPNLYLSDLLPSGFYFSPVIGSKISLAADWFTVYQSSFTAASLGPRF